jgi:hypothetical protein
MKMRENATLLEKRDHMQLEKENIRLFENEANDRELARIGSECASDSDLLRQSLRNCAQLVEDFKQGRALWIYRADGVTIEMKRELFLDPPNPSGEVLRRSLILYPSSRQRMNELQESLNLDDISAVARFALRFFSRVVREAKSGARFFVIDNEGASTEVRFGAVTSDAPRDRKDEKKADNPLPLPNSGGVFVSPTRPKATNDGSLVMREHASSRPK